ncbi:MAG TPA: hypothetical protein VFM90_08340 [Cyclobacteriaceae bacterium]|nr:hypothetical protein [Cyclobacteriaceae bacterium]
MSRLLFFVALVAVALSSRAQNLSVYTNPEGRYALTPSAGWTVRTSGSDSFVYAPEEGDMDPWSEKLEFSKADGEDITLGDAFDFYTNTDFPAAYGKFKLVAKGDETINGLPAKWAVFTFSATGEAATPSGDSTLSATLQALFYVIKKDNALYLINGVTEKSLFASFDLPFRTIIRTFRVVE